MARARDAEADAVIPSRPVLSSAFHAIWTILDDRGRRRLFVVLALMLATAVLEALGTGSILPFMALLVDPGLADRNPALSTFRAFLGIESRESFLVAFGVAVIGLMALVNGANMLLIVGVQRFTWREGARIGESLFRGWLAWPWVKQAHLHSAEATRLLFTEIPQTVSSVMIPFMTVLARSLAILAIAAVLVAIDPATTLATLVVFGGFYVGVYLWLRKRFAAASRQSSEARAEASKTAVETFGNLKDVRVLGLEAPLGERFMAASARNGELQAHSQIAAQLPRYVFETVAFGGLTAIAIAEISRRGASSAAISLVATFAFAGYRILPALQQAYASAALLRASLHSATEMADAVASVAGFSARSELRPPPPRSGAVPPEIRLEGVSFRFPGASRPTLTDVSLTIPPKSLALVVGETGSGKTTLVDLVAGLLQPSAGHILVDGEPLSEDGLPAWRARLGYVAQTPMILDDTIAANITIGREPADASSDESLAAAVAGAQLDRTLRSLPEGLASRVGERGGRLSGGQRQRLAIARALFRRADVLILDESTSALDEETERAVLETLTGLRGRMTVIMISHRPSPRFDADLVIRVEHGTASVEAARPARASAAARS